jgi:hypothetical protein
MAAAVVFLAVVYVSQSARRCTEKQLKRSFALEIWIQTNSKSQPFPQPNPSSNVEAFYGSPQLSPVLSTNLTRKQSDIFSIHERQSS